MDSGFTGEEDSVDTVTRATGDGLIDFGQYSYDQLKDFELTIDRRASPKNYENLIAAIEKRAEEVSAEAGINRAVESRFTRQDGIRGWLEARLTKGIAYGEGSLQIQDENLLIRGWQRTWLGTAIDAIIQLPLSSINDVSTSGSTLRFSVQRSWWRRRYVTAYVSDAATAAELSSRLPALRTKRYESQSVLQEFNAELRARTPTIWVTPALLAINVAVFLVYAILNRAVLQFDPGMLMIWGANFGQSTESGQWWRLVTAMFIHAGVMHLVLNMWVLFNVGRLSERLYGNIPFLYLYFSSGILASFLSIAWNPVQISVGASGAIFGVLGGLLSFLMHPQTPVPRSVFRAHWGSTSLFIIFNLISGALNPVVDNACHVGGLIGGMIIGWFLVPVRTSNVRLGLQRWSAAVVLTVACVGLLFWQIGGLDSELSAPQRYWKTHSWLMEEQVRFFKIAGELDVQANAGNLSEEDLVKKLEGQILPLWTNARERLSREDVKLPFDQEPYGRLIAQFTNARIEWTREKIDAVANRDSGQEKAAAEAMERVQFISAQIARLDAHALLDHRRRALSQNAWLNHARSWFLPTRGKCIGRFKDELVDADGRALSSDGPQQRMAAACLAQRLFESDDFHALESQMKQAERAGNDLPDGSSRMSGLVHGLEDYLEYRGDGRDSLTKLSDWRHAEPDSVNADLVEAMVYEGLAWRARGHGYAKEVTPQMWAQFAQYNLLAAASLADTRPETASVALWHELLLSNVRSRSKKAEEIRKVFNRGIERFPDDMNLYQTMLVTLMPRWQGSYEDVYKFINEMHARLSPTRGFEVYTRLYWAYAVLEGDDTDIFIDAFADWNGMKDGFEEMRKSYPESYSIINAYANFSCRADDSSEYQSLRPKLEGHVLKSAWSTKWSVDSCDKRLL